MAFRSVCKREGGILGWMKYRIYHRTTHLYVLSLSRGIAAIISFHIVIKRRRNLTNYFHLHHNSTFSLSAYLRTSCIKHAHRFCIFMNVFGTLETMVVAHLTSACHISPERAPQQINILTVFVTTLSFDRNVVLPPKPRQTRVLQFHYKTTSIFIEKIHKRYFYIQLNVAYKFSCIPSIPFTIILAICALL